MDVSEVVGAGNVSVSLSRLKVVDEGTYICTVSLGPFHSQQVIQLHVIRKCRSNVITSFKRASTARPSVLPMFLCVSRAAPCHPLRGEGGYDDNVTSDSELSLQ